MVSSYLQVRAAGFLSSQFGLACCCKSKSDWMATMETSNLPALQRSSGYRCFVLHQLKRWKMAESSCCFAISLSCRQKERSNQSSTLSSYTIASYTLTPHVASTGIMHAKSVFMLTMCTSLMINPHWGGYMSLMAPFKGR